MKKRLIMAFAKYLKAHALKFYNKLYYGVTWLALVVVPLEYTFVNYNPFRLHFYAN